jgi:hypothetical protein
LAEVIPEGTVKVPLLVNTCPLVPVLGKVVQVESPRKNVPLSAVPEARRAVGTVPDAMLAAFKLVTFEPVPLNAMFLPL